jgi:hypothetical protein
MTTAIVPSTFFLALTKIDMDESIKYTNLIYFLI